MPTDWDPGPGLAYTVASMCMRLQTANTRRRLFPREEQVSPPRRSRSASAALVPHRPIPSPPGRIGSYLRERSAVAAAPRTALTAALRTAGDPRPRPPAPALLRRYSCPAAAPPQLQVSGRARHRAR
ncbi:hypothetical protein SETIT_9G157400v2 [Setaria italica]|uniref:Uncharacterized protein n=1 Tax=Setaria italica TaxID=4555 RepID=A0A368SH36_SETIT|nr:hypothetical protein SETIT_9G157400v2 [Setaria italica]